MNTIRQNLRRTDTDEYQHRRMLQTLPPVQPGLDWLKLAGWALALAFGVGVWVLVYVLASQLTHWWLA